VPPQRYPCIESHRSWALPAQVKLRPHTYHVSRRLTPSVHSLVSFQPGALTGLHPTKLYLTEIAPTSRRELPLLRLANRPQAGRRLSLLSLHLLAIGRSDYELIGAGKR
jgi:hypothetical protein